VPVVKAPHRVEVPVRVWEYLHQIAVWQQTIPEGVELGDDTWDSITGLIDDTIAAYLPEHIQPFDVETSRVNNLWLVAYNSHDHDEEVRIRLAPHKGRRKLR
jgi:hypothetical protein